MGEVVRGAPDAYPDDQADPEEALAATESPRTLKSPSETSGTVADFLVDTDVFVDHLRGAGLLANSQQIRGETGQSGEGAVASRCG